MDIEDVENLPITEFNMRLEQSINIATIYRHGEFKFVDSMEERENFINEIKYFESIGML